MHVVGIIGEYNPFHNGHRYHIEKVKELFPDSIVVAVVNGYFLERGEISCLSKEDKTKVALEYGIDLVVSLPVVFGTQSADVFAEKAIEILHHLGVTDIVFGSECNDISLLTKIAELQLDPSFEQKVALHLKTGVNYPTALSKALDLDTMIQEPNDLLGISYAKAVLKHHYPIVLHTILRTNSYHDIQSEEDIISASNIRNKLGKQQDISFYVPEMVPGLIQTINYDLVWKILQYRILTDPDLSIYLTVDEGIESRLKKKVLEANDLEDFILKVKTKRYTYNKIRRMLVHILLGFPKRVRDTLALDYISVCGFNQRGQKYLRQLRSNLSIPLTPFTSSNIYEFEKRASFLYDLFTNSCTSSFELRNKPIVKKDFSSFDK